MGVSNFYCAGLSPTLVLASPTGQSQHQTPPTATLYLEHFRESNRCCKQGDLRIRRRHANHGHRKRYSGIKPRAPSLYVGVAIDPRMYIFRLAGQPKNANH